MITPPSWRRVQKVARETVTLDHLSNGRLTLGVELGNPDDLRPYGEAIDPCARLLDEGLERLRGFWDGAFRPFGVEREAACDQPLPWKRPRPQPRLSPGRVRRGLPRLLCMLGSPATTPKPSGRSPGRPTGRGSEPAVRYPAIKKPTKKPRVKQTKVPRAA